MPQRRIRNHKDSLESILLRDSQQEARQIEIERKLLAALNSCSVETRRDYAEMLRH